MISRRFMLFLIAGGLAAAVNFGSRIALSQVMPYVPAIVLAYGLGMLTAFLLNRAMVFTQTDTPLHHQAFWFTVVNLAAVAQTIAVSLLLVRWMFPAIGMRFHPETLAHAVGVALPVITSYIGHRRLTFRSKQDV